MKETFWAYCVNCGKQVLIEDNTSICYWCHKNASKKEGKTMERSTTGEAPAVAVPSTAEGADATAMVSESVPAAVPRRPKKRAALRGYLNQNKDDIIADYHAMRVNDFLIRWHITSNSWIKLKKEWGVPNRSGTGPKKREAPRVTSEHEE